MPILLNTFHDVFEWARNPGYMDGPPDDVMPIYRFLATLYFLDLCRRDAWYNATSRNKVAKLVIKRLEEMP